MERIANASGHEVGVESVLAYHIDRLLAAIEWATREPFAELLAVEHTREAVRAARS